MLYDEYKFFTASTVPGFRESVLTKYEKAIKSYICEEIITYDVGTCVLSILETAADIR
jgi:hypothetical protein